MALPVVKSAIDCADFSNTVLPYAYQLRTLPQVLFESIFNPVAFRQIYLDSNPLITALAFALFLAPIFLIVSEANKNYSQVDRCWSILPTVYIAHYNAYAHMAGLDTTRLDVLLYASVLWSTRLTYNYYRKGGYSVGSEDYRWEVLRKHISPPLFFIFNVFFISLAQSVLLFLITTPAYILLLSARLISSNPAFIGPVPSFDVGDIAMFLALMTFVALAYVADQEQWDYQSAKTSYQATAKVRGDFTQADLDRGFISTGLWSWSRHPNFAAEQSFWILIYIWGLYVTGTPFNWSAAGAFGYVCLFQASTWFTELVSAGKYTDYAQYQAQVGKFIPYPPSVLRGIEWNSSTGSADKKKVDAQTEKEKEMDAAQARKRYDLR